MSTKEAILQELYDTRTYDDCYGVTGARFPKTFFRYTDMYRNTVEVSLVTKTFHADCHNVAVFRYLGKTEVGFVDHGTFQIVANGQPLSTAGLATCCYMVLGTKTFFTHLDACADISPMVSASTRPYLSWGHSIRPDPGESTRTMYTRWSRRTQPIVFACT